MNSVAKDIALITRQMERCHRDNKLLRVQGDAEVLCACRGAVALAQPRENNLCAYENHFWYGHIITNCVVKCIALHGRAAALAEPREDNLCVYGHIIIMVIYRECVFIHRCAEDGLDGGQQRNRGNKFSEGTL